jgi:hypothetical protein
MLIFEILLDTYNVVLCYNDQTKKLNGLKYNIEVNRIRSILSFVSMYFKMSEALKTKLIHFFNLIVQ